MDEKNNTIIVDEDDIPVAFKRAIIEQEVAMWKNTRYQAQIRYKVHKRVGYEAEHLKQIEDEIEKCEKALDALQEELTSLQGE